MKQSRLTQLGAIGITCSLWLLAISGCWEEPKLNSAPAAKSKTLRLIIADDAPMAEQIRQLKGEWNALTGGTLEVDEASLTDTAKTLAGCDAAILDPSRLGELVESNQIVPLPDDLLWASETAWSDVLELTRHETATWGKRVWAVPFGAPTFTLLYRRDILDKLKRPVPTNWKEYQDLVLLLRDRKQLGDLAGPADQPWYGVLEPTQSGWVAKLLLARAAAYAKHPDNYSALFNIDDFTPLIDGPPFVLALEQLLAARGTSDMQAETSPLDPAGVRKMFFAGRCAMAITWPTAADSQVKIARPPSVGIAPLPGADRSYNVAAKAWEPNDANVTKNESVPFAPITGRIGVVSATSAEQEETFRLLVWLSGSKWGTRVASTSPHTTLFRREQANAPADWVEKDLELVTAKQYASNVTGTFASQRWLGGLRIPGQQEYYAALDEAVVKAIAGEQSPAEALHGAAEAWRKISERLGVDQQRKAYRRSLGIDK